MSDEVKDPTEKREELLLAMPDVGEMVLNATYVVPLVNLNRKAVRFAVVSTWGINLDSPDPIEPKILESFESEDLATLYKGATDRMDALKMEINRLRAKAGEPSIDAQCGALRAVGQSPSNWLPVVDNGTPEQNARLVARLRAQAKAASAGLVAVLENAFKDELSEAVVDPRLAKMSTPGLVH